MIPTKAVLLVEAVPNEIMLLITLTAVPVAPERMRIPAATPGAVALTATLALVMPDILLFLMVELAPFA
jgi:hypothetical protein